MYLTYNEFKKICPNEQIDKSNFDTLLSYAETAINQITSNKTETIMSAIKKATAFQILYIYQNDGVLFGADIISESIGEYSYTKNNKPYSVPTIVKNMLYPTGLLYGGIPCR